MNETETEAERVLRVVRTRMDMDEAAEALMAQNAVPGVVVGVVAAGPNEGAACVTWPRILDRRLAAALLREAADQMERSNAAIDAAKNN